MTELFIEKAKLIHGDKYDYSKVDYKNCSTKVKICCKIHGEFEQTPNNHLSGYGCGKCAGTAKSNTNEFIKKVKLINGDKYDYSNVDYKNSTTKVKIGCKIHGEFEQTPKLHLKGHGCLKCGNILNANKRKTPFEDFIKKCVEKYGDLYDYSKVDYKNCDTNITIKCKKHGEFLQTPYQHLNSNGCKKCSGHYTMTTDEFIKKSIKVHGDTYDYSYVNYIDSTTEVIIKCKKHGNFKQKPVYHYWNEAGCPKCANKNVDTNDFIEKAKLIHGDLYDYSLVNYNLSNKEVIIICKIHGEFNQIASYHLGGAGCQKCCNTNYSKMQILWLDFLSKFHNIHIQHVLNNGEFLIPNTNYKADGYCKEINTIYEFHGDFWHGNPKIYKQDEINTKTNCSFKELYEKTLIKENKIKELGYNLVVIWENKWKKINNAIRTIQRKFLQNR
jgi:hypothetical protein